MTVRAVKIPARGKVEVVPLPSEGRLAVMQQAVGGYVQPITYGETIVWTNEDGKRLRLPLNIRATALLMPSLALPDGTVDEIVGDVLVTGLVDGDGEVTDAPLFLDY